VSETARSRLKVSREGIVLIKSFEGFRPRAVRGEDGRWTIGYGHTASAREGATVGERDAELLLQYDLLPVVKALNEQVSQPLNQHQFDALASFAISVGVERFLASDVLQRLNEGHAGEAADALINWPEHATPDSALRRRAAERALFVADPAAPAHLADLLAAPLPPPPIPEPEPEPEPEPAAERTEALDARTAAVAALLGETPDEATRAVPDAEAGEMASPDFPTTSAAGWAPQAPAFQSPASVHLQRYSPYATALIGPLPGFPPAAAAVAPEPAPEPPPEAQPEPQSRPEPETAPMEAAEPAPVVPLAPPPPGPSPFPPEEPLVLTPAVEADFAESRPVWPAEQRESGAGGEEETALFEDEPPLAVLRHEAGPEGARRFDWSETGAYLVMGVTGLVSCAASAAAFRKAMTDTSDLGDFSLIGWVLALIGVICVGVSGWKLYARLGRGD
jgi:lysozyme